MNTSLGNYSKSFQKTHFPSSLRSFVKAPAHYPLPSWRCRRVAGRRGLRRGQGTLALSRERKGTPVLRELCSGGREERDTGKRPATQLAEQTSRRDQEGPTGHLGCIPSATCRWNSGQRTFGEEEDELQGSREIESSGCTGTIKRPETAVAGATGCDLGRPSLSLCNHLL